MKDTLTVFNHDGSTAAVAVVDLCVADGQAHVMGGAMFISTALGKRLPETDTTFETPDGRTWPAWRLPAGPAA